MRLVCLLIYLPGGCEFWVTAVGRAGNGRPDGRFLPHRLVVLHMRLLCTCSADAVTVAVVGCEKENATQPGVTRLECIVY